MYKISLSLLLLLTHISLTAQVLEFDQLEMKYNQKHYKSVYSKAVMLMDDPAYDFSYIPRYYLALSKLQLAQNEKWYKRHKYAITDAMQTFKELSKNYEGQEILRAHQYEISALKSDLKLWLYNLESGGDQKLNIQLKDLIENILPKVPEVSEMKEDRVVSAKESSKKDAKIKIDDKKNILKESEPSIPEEREGIVQFSTSLLGTPYKWAGITPTGFDCSGFTCYVTKIVLNKEISHIAGVQFKECKKIKRKDVHPGDLIFFKNGPKISHVGIVFSTNNGSIQMIHASSSVGISIVDIYQSAYWKKRIAGFGTFLQN